jgi:hypothetical protein
MIKTQSQFWYGWEITVNNQYVDFQYASDLTPRLAVIPIGKYSSDELCIQLQTQIANLGGPAIIFVTFDRIQKKFILTCSVGFTLLCNSGAHSSVGGAWAVLGFSTSSDRSGSLTYTADSSSLLQWRPQFMLQGLTTPGQLRGLRDPVYAESSSGVGELSHFGEIQYIEFEAMWITDIMGQKVIENDCYGVENANAFMQWITKKANFEFMPDRNNPAVYYQLKLETTPEDSKGLGYRLIEDYDKGRPNYFRTGKLRSRIVT